MYFQLEVDCYSNEANKNKYKKVQLIASTKKQLKDSYRLLCCLDFVDKVLCCLGLMLLESIFIELESIFIEFESILLLESYFCFSKCETITLASADCSLPYNKQN